MLEVEAGMLLTRFLVLVGLGTRIEKAIRDVMKLPDWNEMEGYCELQLSFR